MRRFEKERRREINCLYTSVATTTPLNWFFAIISVNQLSIYGAVADMCDELACGISGCSERTGELVAQDTPETMLIPTELSTTNKSTRTDDNVQTSKNSQIFQIIFN